MMSKNVTVLNEKMLTATYQENTENNIYNFDTYIISLS